MTLRAQLTIAVVLVVTWCGARSSRAEPLGAVRIGLIDTQRLWSARGITRWANARAKLDAEQDKFVALEQPPGDTDNPVDGMDLHGLGLSDAQIKKMRDDERQRTAQSRAWDLHEHERLDPIEADVQQALAKFIEAHKLDLVLDRSALEGLVFYQRPGVDITDAFVDEYNRAHRATAK